MDNKSWLWKKKSAEKTLIADKANISSLMKEEEAAEIQTLLTEKSELEKHLRISNEKLASALADCNAKDDFAKKQVKIAQEAIAGWEKVETEAIALKQELDKVLNQKVAAEQRLSHLDAALKECMQQLRFVRDEQEKRIHDAVIKTSKESEKTQIILDEKLAATTKRLAKVDAENAQLSKAMLGKDKVIEDLSKHRAQLEADFNALRLRVESTEKENASLKYEVRVLEKELDIRNEEREFNLRTAENSHKQNLESVKKIARLESECQRLRVLVRKRLPGPAALAKMKSEVEMLGRDQFETRRRKSNPSMISSMDFSAPDTHSKRVDMLMEQLHAMEEENKILKEALDKKLNELQFPKQLEDSSKSQRCLHEPSLVAMSEMDSDDKASCAESWASALISELEHFKNEKQSHRTVGNAEMNLMDDFAEMEKLAVVSVDYPVASSNPSSEEGNAGNGLSGSSFNGDLSHGPGIQDPVISLEDGGQEGHLSPKKLLSTEKGGQKFKSNTKISISKILELVEGINVLSNGTAEPFSGKDDKLLPYKNSETPTGYTVRVFQWKTSELTSILQQFVRACNELLNGGTDLEQFAELVASDLEWIINHCFSLQDVSSMKDAIRSHFDWDESRSEGEVDSGLINHLPEENKWKVHINEMGNFERNEKEDDQRLDNELANKEALVADLEERLQSEISRSESLTTQIQEYKDVMESLQVKMESMKLSRDELEDENEKHKKMKEDLEVQLMETNLELSKAQQQISYLEQELEEKNNCCQRLDKTCHDLQIQLASLARKEDSRGRKPGEKKVQNEWEILEASEKLAECQETILNLGKQLKALASPNAAALFDKVMSAPTDSIVTSTSRSQGTISHRSSLLDKMLAEDNAQLREDVQDGMHHFISQEKDTELNGINQEENTSLVGPLAIVPGKRKGGRSLWRRIFWIQKKGYKKKTSFP